MNSELQNLLARWHEGSLTGLRLWSRASIAALTLALITTSWLILPHLQKNADDLHSDPDYIAQLMLETQLSDSP